MTSPIALSLPLSDWSSAWRHDTGHLLLPSRVPLKPGALVEVTVGLGTGDDTGTLLAAVVSTRRVGAQHQIEVAPLDESVRLASMVAAAARGVPVAFRTRAPRHRFKVPVVVAGAQQGSYMNTTSVSARGCAIRWSGPLPEVGKPIGLRFGMGTRAVCLQGVIRWARNRPSGPAVGVELQTSGAAGAGWATLLAGASRDRSTPVAS